MEYGPGRFVLFGLPFLDLAFDDALGLVDRLTGQEGTSALYIPNAHTLNLASRDPDFKAVLSQGDALFGDGTGIRLAALLRGRRLAANLNGTDLVPEYLSSRNGVRYFLLGGEPEAIAKAARGAAERFPQAQLVGFHDGFFDKDDCRPVIDRINAARPDLVLVGMGNPIQENWIHRHRDQLDAGLCIGVGGLFRYWEGSLKRAPGWMRASGLEWLSIMLRQPWKIGRYMAGNPAFLLRSLVTLPGDVWKRWGAVGT